MKILLLFALLPLISAQEDDSSVVELTNEIDEDLLLSPEEEKILKKKTKKNKEIKSLKEQVEEMLQEVRNQNHAIFKQADHSRIISSKVSELSGTIRALKEENTQLKEKIQLNEFKVAKKVKKVRTRLAEIEIRLGIFFFMLGHIFILQIFISGKVYFSQSLGTKV